MVEVPITIACGNYDRTSAIRDGRVKVEGCAVTYLPLYPEEIFHRAFKFQEFDVSELSFSSYLRTVAAGTSAYVGIPAFVSRIFRHSGIYVRTDSGIRPPQDLRVRIPSTIRRSRPQAKRRTICRQRPMGRRSRSSRGRASFSAAPACAAAAH